MQFYKETIAVMIPNMIRTIKEDGEVLQKLAIINNYDVDVEIHIVDQNWNGTLADGTGMILNSATLIWEGDVPKNKIVAISRTNSTPVTLWKGV